MAAIRRRGDTAQAAEATIAISRKIMSLPGVFGLKPPPVAPNTIPPAAVTATPIPNVEGLHPVHVDAHRSGPQVWSAWWPGMAAELGRTG